MILAIDPGADTGWSLFENRILQRCGLGDPPISSGQEWVLIERPEFYKGRTAKGADPNDLIILAMRVGRLIERAFARGVVRVTTVTPHEWKGQIPKDVHERRMRLKLYPEELVRVEQAMKEYPTGKRHNVWDAIGLGLFACERRA